MALSSKLFPAVLLVLLLATEMGLVQEAAAEICQEECQSCAGPCTFDDECSITCRNEGFETGECRGMHHRCICKKTC